MDTVRLKIIEIMNNLPFAPPEKLDEINHFIQLLSITNKARVRRPISVRGNWENKGFENINIEKTLKKIRKESRLELDQKQFF
jgi:hypothetical protein